METIPQHELEQLVDRLFDETDKLAFEAMSRILTIIRGEQER